RGGAAEFSAPEREEESRAPGAPSVSVVIPCYNEERFIGKVLENLAGQYPAELYEIIVVDGMSTDETREVVAEFARRRPGIAVRLVDNPARNIPAALNLGINEARNELIVRMDAHSVPSENYVRRCVEVLAAGEAAIVGMPWRIRPGAETRAARAIALAVAHPFGIGDAKYRLAPKAAEFVDTVPFGAFRKSLWLETGGFNEQLLANEDYDFHYRVRQRGGRILLDAEGHSAYFARESFKALATQYSRYGRWKARMVKEHPRSLRLRQMVAPAFVVSVLTLAALSCWWRPALLGLGLVVVPYVALAVFFAFRLARRARELSLLPAIVLAFMIIHTAWGASFLAGLIRSPRGGTPQE
ncbi:MAG TPA: glycosyltransferase family 2 protein, partial [Pyrinomonadaceae bacterium]|nr:glycosyltransferase family 2 protein [Pyrinomonadaceae bacterium]